MDAASAAPVGALIQTLARLRTAAAPPPRALPYLGLEHESGTAFHLLDLLSRRGIFRKYELVLEIGAGLGGHARWMGVRLGCDVVGTTPTAGEADAANALTRRTQAATRVDFVAAHPDRLPFGRGRFTHVWIVEALPRVPDVASAVFEAPRLPLGS